MEKWESMMLVCLMMMKKYIFKQKEDTEYAPLCGIESVSPHLPLHQLSGTGEESRVYKFICMKNCVSSLCSNNFFLNIFFC